MLQHRSRNLTLLALLTITATAPAQTVAPAQGRPFALPLADATTGQAIILPGPNAHHFVWTDTKGNIAFASLQFTPTPPPPPPKPPPPPPTTIAIAIVENPYTTTPTQRGILTDNAWRTAIPPPHTFLGIIPNNYLDPDTHTPPAHLAPFLRAASGHTLPVVIQLTPDASLYRADQLPDSTTALIALFPKTGPATNATPDNRQPQLHPTNQRTPRPPPNPQALPRPTNHPPSQPQKPRLQTPHSHLRLPILCPACRTNH